MLSRILSPKNCLLFYSNFLPIIVSHFLVRNVHDEQKRPRNSSTMIEHSNFKGIENIVYVFGHDQKRLHRAETFPFLPIIVSHFLVRNVHDEQKRPRNSSTMIEHSNFKGIENIVYVFGHDQKRLHRAETFPKLKQLLA